MTKIFNNPYTQTDSWSTQGAVVNWGTSPSSLPNSIPLVMSGIRMGYGRQSQAIYPIAQSEEGTHKKVIINGAPSGTLEITSIYSPTMDNMEAFIAAVSRDCKSSKNNSIVYISLRPFGSLKCTTDNGQVGSTSKAGTILLSGVDLQTLGLTIQGGEVAIVNMPLTFTFTDLDWDFGKTK